MTSENKDLGEFTPVTMTLSAEVWTMLGQALCSTTAASHGWSREIQLSVLRRIGDALDAVDGDYERARYWVEHLEEVSERP